MKVNSDYRDLLLSLNEASVRYLVVGGYAWMVHQEPRYTKDLDVWIEAVPANAEALLSALHAFGAPITGILPADLTQPEVFLQIGVEPVRVDILTSVPGLDFVSAWGRKVTVAFGGVPAPVLSWADVQTAKAAASRKQDQKDLKTAARRARRKRSR
jgi:hypothetical protein